MTADTIALLKISLNDVKPVVLRRIEVPFSIRLDRLHLVLQAAIGWTNSHLYEIRIDDTGWGVPDPSWRDGPLDASKARLDKVIEDVDKKTFSYLYDFGDGWSHTIKIERLTDAIPRLVYPSLIEASGRCPPEDIGGPAGYADFLEAIADPQHEGHADALEWAEPDFDPHPADIAAHQSAIGVLAQRWAPKPRAKRTKPI